MWNVTCFEGLFLITSWHVRCAHFLYCKWWKAGRGLGMRLLKGCKALSLSEKLRELRCPVDDNIYGCLSTRSTSPQGQLNVTCRLINKYNHWFSQLLELHVANLATLHEVNIVSVPLIITFLELISWEVYLLGDWEVELMGIDFVKVHLMGMNPSTSWKKKCEKDNMTQTHKQCIIHEMPSHAHKATIL